MKKEEFVPGVLVELYQKGRDGEKPICIPGQVLGANARESTFMMLSFFNFVETVDLHMDEQLFRPITLDQARTFIAERTCELENAVRETGAIRKMYEVGSEAWSNANDACIVCVRRYHAYLARSGEWLAKMNAAS